MIRKGVCKLIYYQNFEPELFDLEDDFKKQQNLAHQRENFDVLQELLNEPYAICDPAEIDTLAHSDQIALIERLGGRERALNLGAPVAKPPPTFNSIQGKQSEQTQFSYYFCRPTAR